MANKAILLRGIPGSGKSTYARREFPTAKLCSADSFFVKDGVYVFDPTKLPQAHRACWVSFAWAVIKGSPVVLVDNTGISAWELAPYVLHGEAFGYEVEIHRMMVDQAIAAGRNVHGVPAEAVERMHERLLNEKLPPWWKVVEIPTG